LTEKRPRIEPKALSEIVPSVLKEIEGGRGGEALREVRAAWPEIVGAMEARRAKPVALREGTLDVSVESAALRHHLSTFRGGDILEALRRRFPKAGIRAVRFR
jgi:hypothetical protein